MGARLGREGIPPVQGKWMQNCSQRALRGGSFALNRNINIHKIYTILQCTYQLNTCPFSETQTFKYEAFNTSTIIFNTRPHLINFCNFYHQGRFHGRIDTPAKRFHATVIVLMLRPLSRRVWV